ncbi:MAG TPA: ribose-phosphate pyrophosphokinase [Dehalococcoidia bacterium]|nr:ribose-phosphate pyrophosphokinase [Dehalococcoidia bacterium]
MTPHKELAGGDLVLIAGSANHPLASAIADDLGLVLWPIETSRFPDGEAHVQLGASVRGRDVYLIQPTSPPVDGHLMELLLLADASYRAGADRLTAVIPYFGYARQDRRSSGRESIAARVVCDLLGQVGIDRVVALDLHSPAVEGFLSVPLEHLTAVPILAAHLQPLLPPEAVVVAPDLGAIRLAERYAEVLELPVAIVQKTRLGPAEVRATAVIGDVSGRVPVIVDDMVSTGATIEAAARALVAGGAAARMIVAATHGLFVGECAERFAALPLERLVVTDSVQATPALPNVERVGVAGLLAEAITRIHHDQAVSGLLFQR